MKVVESNIAMTSYSKNVEQTYTKSNMKVSLDMGNAPLKSIALFDAKAEASVYYDFSEQSLLEANLLKEAKSSQLQDKDIKISKEDLIQNLENQASSLVQNNIDLTAEETSQLKLLREMLNTLFGKSGSDFMGLGKDIKRTMNAAGKTQNSSQPRTMSPKIRTMELNYKNLSVKRRSASTTFKSVGKINTADGRSIDLNLSFKAAFEQVQYSASEVSMTYKERPMIDPLVLNMDSSSFGLSDITIDFDLDSDGVLDSIHVPNSGSGFLVLDKNDNGNIDDGSELFGTKSGDGFKDLAEYDSDKNGWIDESDAVFDDLKLLIHDSKGRATMKSIKDLGIGAIYLGSAETTLRLTGAEYDKGMLRKTGFFLKESGEASTMQHIDLSI